MRRPRLTQAPTGPASAPLGMGSAMGPDGCFTNLVPTVPITPPSRHQAGCSLRRRSVLPKGTNRRGWVKWTGWVSTGNGPSTEDTTDATRSETDSGLAPEGCAQRDQQRTQGTSACGDSTGLATCWRSRGLGRSELWLAGFPERGADVTVASVLESPRPETLVNSVSTPKRR